MTEQSTSAEQAELRELLDKAAIRQLIDRYWCGEDRNDPDMVASVFTTDARYGGLRGQDHIREVMKGLDAYVGMHHLVGSQLIELSGDTATADTMAIGWCLADTPAGRQVLCRGLRYLDQLVRTDDGWRISERSGFDDRESGHDTTWQSDSTVVPYWGPHQRS